MPSISSRSPAPTLSRSHALPLSPREIEVLRLVAEGCSNREIADALVISERTAVHHVSHILDKLAVPSRAAATAWAFRPGLVAGADEPAPR